MAKSAPAAPYATLDPDTVLDAVAAAGFEPDGRLLALGSYENRVYQVGLEDARPLVAKFYRPGRWSDAAIDEEHAFAHELAAAELPMVAPLVVDGRSLFEHEGFRYALYPRQGGRAPELESADHLAWMGRLLARLHAIGARHAFRARPAIDVDGFVREAARNVLASGLLPPTLEARYGRTLDALAAMLDERIAAVGPASRLRLHGDCHLGNVLWTDAGPHFVDLDDCLSGPAIQDLWMLIAGSRAEMSEQLTQLLEGYTHFSTFERREVGLIESLRTLRMIHYSAWLARRWSDPAFPQAFPWFEEPRYWENHVLQLREQQAAIAEGPLEL